MMRIASEIRRQKRRMRNVQRRMGNWMRGASPTLSGYMSARPSWGMDEFELARTKLLSGNSWDEYRISIATEFSGNPTGFLRETTISRTLHPNETEQALLRLNEMKKRCFDRERILPFLYDTPFGDPYLCDFFPLASPNTIHKGYHLSMLKRHLNIFVDDLDFLADFGGGYGNFCRVVHNLGFAGKFTIVDFPDMHIIQKFYLEHTTPGMDLYDIDWISVSDIESYTVPDNRSLFVATYSLNETPLNVRGKIEKFLSSFRYFLITYNRLWEGIDNQIWFSGLKNRLDHEFEIEVVSEQFQRAWYLLGRRR